MYATTHSDGFRVFVLDIRPEIVPTVAITVLLCFTISYLMTFAATYIANRDKFDLNTAVKASSQIRHGIVAEMNQELEIVAGDKKAEQAVRKHYVERLRNLGGGYGLEQFLKKRR